MTMIFTKPNIFDAILKLLGKKRAYRMPKKVEPYVYRTFEPESFLRALRRPAAVPPPAGWFYKEDFTNAGTYPAPQPKGASSARTRGHFRWSQISALTGLCISFFIRTFAFRKEPVKHLTFSDFSCFLGQKIICKALMRELIPQPKGASSARK